MQATVWLAEKQARESVQRIQFRVDHGATVERGELMFDGKLQMVRTRKIVRSRKAETGEFLP